MIIFIQICLQLFKSRLAKLHLLKLSFLVFIVYLLSIDKLPCMITSFLISLSYLICYLLYIYQFHSDFSSIFIFYRLINFFSTFEYRSVSFRFFFNCLARLNLFVVYIYQASQLEWTFSLSLFIEDSHRHFDQMSQTQRRLQGRSLRVFL